MLIYPDVKLDYSDVLLRPKRSRLLSRSEVTLTRKFKFPHSSRIWKGVPIVASNMSTIGTFSVANIFAEYKMLTCIHKHYSNQDWIEVDLSYENLPCVAISMSKNVTFDIAGIILDYPTIPFLCLDVANGYSQPFSDFVGRLGHFQTATIHIVMALESRFDK